MNFIKEKKIHKAIVIVITFLALGYSSFYSVRSMFAAYAAEGVFNSNDVVSFLLSAISAGAIYELITMLLFKANARKIGQLRARDMQYALRFFVIPVGILSGALKTLYFFFPYLFNYGEVFIEFLLLFISFGFYIAFCCKNYCVKEEYATIATVLGSAVLLLYGVLAVLSLLSGVLL